MSFMLLRFPGCVGLRTFVVGLDSLSFSSELVAAEASSSEMDMSLHSFSVSDIYKNS